VTKVALVGTNVSVIFVAVAPVFIQVAAVGFYVTLIAMSVAQVGIPIPTILVNISFIRADVPPFLGGIGFVAVSNILTQFGAVLVDVAPVGIDVPLIAAGIAQIGISIRTVAVKVSAVLVNVSLIAISVADVLAQVLSVFMDVGGGLPGLTEYETCGHEQKCQAENASSHMSSSPTVGEPCCRYKPIHSEKVLGFVDEGRRVADRSQVAHFKGKILGEMGYALCVSQCERGPVKSTAAGCSFEARGTRLKAVFSLVTGVAKKRVFG
jgi:hypothetical protein